MGTIFSIGIMRSGCCEPVFASDVSSCTSAIRADRPRPKPRFFDVDFAMGCEIAGAEADTDGVRIETAEGAIRRHDRVVVCAGTGSRALARGFGDRVNIYPVKGYSITVNLDDAASQKAGPGVSLLDDEAKVVTSRLGKNRLRIAGTAEFNGYNLDIRDDRIKPLRDWCETFFPAVSTEHCVPWAGLRPMLPSMMPKVGPGKKPGVFYNTGHGHLGWTLSAATAQGVADSIDATRMKNAA